MGTIKDVARSAGVSVSTVSNAFSEKRYINSETKMKVLQIAKEMNYTPNLLASSIVTKKTHIIGLFLTSEHDRFDAFYSELIRGVTLTLSQNAYFAMLYVNIDGQKSFEEAFNQSMIFLEGAIILTPSKNDFRTLKLSQEKVPYVLIGRADNKNDGKYTVDVDNKKIAYEITRRMIEQGHRKIVLLNSIKDYTITSDRLAGYKAALKEREIEFDKNLVFNLIDSLESRDKIFKVLNGLQNNYTAIITSSDINANCVYEHAKINGKTIGRDLAVAAMGGDVYTDKLTPSLTSVSTDYNLLGQEAAKLVMDILSNNITTEQNILNHSKVKWAPSSEFTL